MRVGTASVSAVTVEGQLAAMVQAGNWRELATHLARLDEGDLASARRWYRAEGKSLARSLVAEAARRPWDQHRPRWGWLVRAVLAIGLGPSASTAAKEARLARSTWGDDEPADYRELVELLVSRGPQWCTAFIESTEPAARGDDVDRALGRFAQVAIPLVSRLDLPLPASEAYVRGWVQHTFTGTRGGTLDSSLAATWSAAPHLAQSLVATLSLGGAVSSWEALEGEDFSLEEQVRELVRREPEAREPILEAALGLLSRQESRGAQRVVVRILAGLDLTSADLGSRVPLLVNVLPAVHGVVTAALLPLLLAADLEPADLADLGATILARKEKAQKLALVQHLAARAGGKTGEPAMRQVVVDLLSTAALSEDSAFAAKARKVLDGLGEQSPEGSPVSVAVAWRSADDVPPPAPRPFELFEASAAGVAALYAASTEGSFLTVHSSWLDLAMRLAARDAAELRAALRELPEKHWGQPVSFRMLQDWATRTEPLDVVHTDIGWLRSTDSRSEVWRGLAPSTAFLVRLTRETIARLGTDDTLLSTPSRADGTLELEVLVARMRAASGYHPLDLQQALLRLGPLEEGSLALLEGVSLPPAKAPGRFSRLLGAKSVPDGGEVLRDWVRGGGLPARLCTVAAGVPVAPAVQLPVILPEAEPLSDLVAPIDKENLDPLDSHPVSGFLDVVPWWPDASVTALGMASWIWFERAMRPDFSATAGVLGPAVHHHLLVWLAEDLEHRRLTAAAELSTLAAQGRLDATLLREAALAMSAQGELPLARAAAACEHVILTGGLSAVWPTLTGLAEAAASAPRLPAGLADLLRVMQPYAAAAEPHHPLPAVVRELAVRKGSTKAVVEARALVAAASAPVEGAAP